MYIVTFTIESSCGLSKVASMLDSPVFSSSVQPLGRGRNLFFAESISKNNYRINKALLSDFKDVSIFHQGKFFYLKGVKMGHGVMDGIISSLSVPLFPVIAQKETETFHFISFNRESIETALDKVGAKNKIIEHNYNLISEGDSINGSVILSKELLRSIGLTKSELMSLRLAKSRGYFDWPRKENLSEISREMNLSKVTVLYHIRNAEKKLLELLTNDFVE